MTREEAIELNKETCCHMSDELIHAIYNSFENRTCESCKYNKEVDGFMVFCDKSMCEDGSRMLWHSFTKDFYCKYWESKRDGIDPKTYSPNTCLWLTKEENLKQRTGSDKYKIKTDC